MVILTDVYETQSYQALTCNIKATFTASFMALQTKKLFVTCAVNAI
jgi:hypothetical protein